MKVDSGDEDDAEDIARFLDIDMLPASEMLLLRSGNRPLSVLEDPRDVFRGGDTVCGHVGDTRSLVSWRSDVAGKASGIRHQAMGQMVTMVAARYMHAWGHAAFIPRFEVERSATVGAEDIGFKSFQGVAPLPPSVYRAQMGLSSATKDRFSVFPTVLVPGDAQIARHALSCKDIKSLSFLLSDSWLQHRRRAKSGHRVDPGWTAPLTIPLHDPSRLSSWVVADAAAQLLVSKNYAVRRLDALLGRQRPLKSSFVRELYKYLSSVCALSKCAERERVRGAMLLRISSLSVVGEAGRKNSLSERRSCYKLLMEGCHEHSTGFGIAGGIGREFAKWALDRRILRKHKTAGTKSVYRACRDDALNTVVLRGMLLVGEPISCGRPGAYWIRLVVRCSCHLF